MKERILAITVFMVGVVLPLAGCAYRLPVVSPASQQLIQIAANAPEQYAVQVNTGTVKEYEVPQDGRIKVEILAYRPSCGIFLFDAIKVGGYEDPLKSWNISVTHNGKIVYKKSVRGTLKSPTDDAGYHLLRIAR